MRMVLPRKMRVRTVELRAQFPDVTASRSAPTMRDEDIVKTKSILPTMAVLALLVGISGCVSPVRNRQDWRDDWREDRYAQGRVDHSGRDCWSDGRRYCRDGD